MKHNIPLKNIKSQINISDVLRKIEIRTTTNKIGTLLFPAKETMSKITKIFYIKKSKSSLLKVI